MDADLMRLTDDGNPNYPPEAKPLGTRKKVVFFDMDGVLADFVGATIRVHNLPLKHADCGWDFWTPHGLLSEEFWAPLADYHFWANLEPLPDGMDLFRRVEATIGTDRIGLLSSGLCPGSCDGKRDWLKRHLPAYAKSAVFCTTKHLCAAPCKLLVDDHEPNVTGFIEHGGSAVLVPRPWNSRRGETCDRALFNVDAVLREVEQRLDASGHHPAA